MGFSLMVSPLFKIGMNLTPSPKIDTPFDHKEKMTRKSYNTMRTNGVGNGTLSNASVYGQFWKPLYPQHVIFVIRQEEGKRGKYITTARYWVRKKLNTTTH